MKASEEILAIWQRFDDKPMDTLMKLWWAHQSGSGSQRPVSVIKEHYKKYRVAGNCIDLSLWLLDEFREAGIEAYGITDDIEAERAHIAVVAVDCAGHRYLCDLGDQWIQPVALDAELVNHQDYAEGFFPAAKVKLLTEGHITTISYQRPNGKVSTSTYDTTPLEDSLLLEISERVQKVFRKTF